MQKKGIGLILLAVLGGLLGWFLVGSQREKPAVQPELEPGLYWYGRNQTSQKAEVGTPNPYYDPDKPVIIFVHGWMPNQAGSPPTFRFHHLDEQRDIEYTYDLAEAWLNDGWNIGIYYWHPFADEDVVWDAEDKIWTAETAVAMRWRDATGTYHTDNMPRQSASQLFYNAYRAALRDYTGPEIRVAGHSLGNQMATLLTLQIIEGIAAGEVTANLLPARLTLLDPFWSPLDKAYLDGQRTGTVLRQRILEEVIPRGIAVEWIRSSLLTETSVWGEYTPELQQEATYIELDPDFCAAIDQTCRHDAAWHLYFLSFAYNPPQECLSAPGTEDCVPTGISIPMAGTATKDVLPLMSLPYGWTQIAGSSQVNGRITPNTDDDWFTRIEIAKEP